MTKTGPDYGAEAPGIEFPKLWDSSELAARLGALTRIYRTGNLIWEDDFETSIGNWIVDNNQASGTIATDTTYAYAGDKSLKCTAGKNGYFWVNNKQIYIESPNTAIQGFFRAEYGEYQSFGLMARIQGKTTKSTPIYYFDGTTGKLWVDSTLIDTLTVGKPGFWYSMRISWNINTGKYDTLHFGDNTYDISNLSLPAGENLNNPATIQPGFYIGSATGGTSNIWVDSFQIFANVAND